MTEYEKGLITGIAGFAIGSLIWDLSKRLFGPTIRYLLYERNGRSGPYRNR